MILAVFAVEPLAAEQIVDQRTPVGWKHLAINPPWTFFKTYVMRRGFLDGAEGLAAIGRAGGCTVVQEPGGAAVPFLPEAALREGPVDFVLSLAQLQSLFQTWGMK